MRKILYLTLSLLTIVSCQEFDDSAIWDKIENHEKRIKALEELCNRLNDEIAAQQSILEALQENDYVTGVADILEGNQHVGYTIYFYKGEPVNIYFGEDGSDGQNGADGKPGSDGADGVDGRVPVIAIIQDIDGHYYWTLDGEWMTDADGNRIRANGQDGENAQNGTDGRPGADGADGEDGKDGLPGNDGIDGMTPQLKIEDDFWYVSYDNGVTWIKLYKAKVEDGVDGDSFFDSVDMSDSDFVVIKLTNGQEIKLPTWAAFEQLQIMVNQINTNISSLQQIVSAIEDHDFVVDMSPIIENGEEVGYTIFFSKSLPVTIYHGKDGKDGIDGEDGADGEDGEDGKDGVDGAPGNDGVDGNDGHTPVIGVKQGSDGLYYWTVDGKWMADLPDNQIPSNNDSYWVIDGEWLVDQNGNKIPVAGKDGKDAITPRLKIDNGYWYVSYDSGRTWNKNALGIVNGSPDDNVFADISSDDDYLYLVLMNGETLKVARYSDSQTIGYSINLSKTTFHSAIFTGKIDVPEEDLIYSNVIIYYSESENFNIHSAASVSTQAFEYNGRFNVTIDGLNSDSIYKYCFYVETEDRQTYSPVMEFKTDVKIGKFLDLLTYTTETGCVSTSGGSTTWSTSTSYLHLQVDLSELGNPDWITIKANSTYTTYIAVFNEKATADHFSKWPPYASGWYNQAVMTKGTEKTFDLPHDAKYLYVLHTNSSKKNILPESIEYDCSKAL